MIWIAYVTGYIVIGIAVTIVHRVYYKKNINEGTAAILGIVWPFTGILFIIASLFIFIPDKIANKLSKE